MTGDERAEEELKLKRETLQLEREKFRHTRNREMINNVASAWVRGVNALQLANGAVMFACVAYYAQISTAVGQTIVGISIFLAFIGLLMSVIPFIIALDLVAFDPNQGEPAREGMRKSFATITVTAIISFVLFITSVSIPIYRINIHPANPPGAASPKAQLLRLRDSSRARNLDRSAASLFASEGARPPDRERSR